MHLLLRRALALGAVTMAVPAAITATSGVAHAAPVAGHVYLLSNQVSGNRLLVFDRGADGTLSPAGSVDAGGTGTGGGLGSQGAVVLDESGRYVFAVNAGSNSIASFRVRPDAVERVDVVPSGGTMPTSITVHDGLVYVLNAGGSGSIAGFTATDGDLTPLAGSTRPLSSSAAAAAQVSFTPAGDQLLVTERATKHIDLYSLDAGGYATGPTVAPSAGTTPFGFGFDNKGHAIVSEAFGGAPDASAVSSYTVGVGALTTVSASVPTTETAACWIAVTTSGRFAYAGNAGGSITGYAVRPDGRLEILDADGRTAAATTGITDLALARNSKFLYARMSDGTVGAWSVASDGSLSGLGSTPGLPPGAAGIAAA